MTSTALLEERVLKTDALGRVRTSAERRNALLDEFEKSSMSVAKFAEFVGVKYQTLASWVQRRRRDQRKRAAEGAVQTMTPHVHFVEAMVQKTQATGRGAAPGGLRIDLPGGASVEIAGREQMLLLGELLRVLQERERVPGC
jgi:hypothetical protein